MADLITDKLPAPAAPKHGQTQPNGHKATKGKSDGLKVGLRQKKAMAEIEGTREVTASISRQALKSTSKTLDDLQLAVNRSGASKSGQILAQDGPVSISNGSKVEVNRKAGGGALESAIHLSKEAFRNLDPEAKLAWRQQKRVQKSSIRSEDKLSNGEKKLVKANVLTKKDGDLAHVRNESQPRKAKWTVSQPIGGRYTKISPVYSADEKSVLNDRKMTKLDC
jgi:hypothetical protein